MKTRDVIVGFLVVVAFVTALVLVKNKNNKAKITSVSPTPSIEQKVTSQFGGLVIPKDADKADLSDVNGGPGLGEAVKISQKGRFNITVLADLVAPNDSKFYQAWAVKDGTYVSLGKLRVAKGGYIADFVSTTDYSDYKTIIVSLEKVFDSTPEIPVLKGSF